MATDDPTPSTLPSLADLGYHRVLLAVLVVALVVTSLYAGATTTTAFGVYTQSWDGASELRQLGDQTDTPTRILRDTTGYPADGTSTLAVVLSPAEPYTPTERQRLAEFVESGGTLVIAEDFRPHSNGLLAAIDAQSRFDGHIVRDERYYASSPAFPVATNLSDHPLTAGSDQLTLNHGTVLDPAANATVLANTSEYAYLDTNRNAELDQNESLATHAIVATESVGDGRVVLVSDPSMFINAMLDEPGNRAFARNLVTSADRVLVDTTHTAGQLPPLRYALLTLRDSSILAFLVGGLAVFTIAFWQRDVLPMPLRRSSEPRSLSPELSPDRFADAVAERHPDWDRTRIERVVQALMSENEPEESND